MSKLKLISLNIEIDRHPDTVLPFLRKENPDVACLQEVLEKDVPVFETALGMKSYFAPVSIVDLKYFEGKLVTDEELVKKGPQGIAFFTRLPVREGGVEYYHGNPKEVTRHSVDYSRCFLWREVEKEDTVFTIGTTHFTWTPDGSASAEQRQDAKSLLAILQRFPDIVFCGDFNAPRGDEIWNLFAERYHDNIPLEYVSSIDPELHRVKGLKRLVDGLFTTPSYRTSEVKLVGGVSDHMAVVGLLEKRD